MIIYHWTGYSGTLYILKLVKECDKILKLKLLWPDNRTFSHTQVHKADLEKETWDAEIWTTDASKIPPLLAKYKARKDKEYAATQQKIKDIEAKLKA